MPVDPVRESVAPLRVIVSNQGFFTDDDYYTGRKLTAKILSRVEDGPHVQPQRRDADAAALSYPVPHIVGAGSL
ncbi:hypothetical protein SAMN05661093_08042 [Kibdelosporangium aridum]|uniref:Uncharacterized protein n=1 Tax=Kibdelosporangium aridum TaxID=2030 RepID=A0A1Y5Y1N2_KIBAR|nr:hypothetical protein SAMN05661093_08042 [Kibdelosporangium aridum]